MKRADFRNVLICNTCDFKLNQKLKENNIYTFFSSNTLYSTESKIENNNNKAHVELIEESNNINSNIDIDINSNSSSTKEVKENDNIIVKLDTNDISYIEDNIIINNVSMKQVQSESILNNKSTISTTLNMNYVYSNISNLNYTSYHLSKIEKFQESIKLKPFNKLQSKSNQKLKQSLYQSMIIKGYRFSDDLIYSSEEQLNMNKACKEPGLFPSSEHNHRVFHDMKKYTRKGDYCGLEIIGNIIQGFTVRAYVDIPSLTFICEYSGEVALQRKVFFESKNDSIMELLKTPSSINSLVIKPEQYCNIARFISGINNHKSESFKKINVNSIKMNINNEAHIILYASRNIKKGEILYYDYNRGGYEYPTDKFE